MQVNVQSALKSLFFSVLRLQTTVMFCLEKRISMIADTSCQPSTGSGSDTAAVCLMSKIGYKKCEYYQVLPASGLPGVLWFDFWWGSELFLGLYNTILIVHFFRKLFLNLISLLKHTTSYLIWVIVLLLLEQMSPEIGPTPLPTYNAKVCLWFSVRLRILLALICITYSKY